MKSLQCLRHLAAPKIEARPGYGRDQFSGQVAQDLNVLQSAVVVDDKDVRAWFGAVSHDKSTWCNAKDSFVGF